MHGEGERRADAIVQQPVLVAKCLKAQDPLTRNADVSRHFSVEADDTGDPIHRRVREVDQGAHALCEAGNVIEPGGGDFKKGVLRDGVHLFVAIIGTSRRPVCADIAECHHGEDDGAERRKQDGGRYARRRWKSGPARRDFA